MIAVDLYLCKFGWGSGSVKELLICIICFLKYLHINDIILN